MVEKKPLEFRYSNNVSFLSKTTKPEQYRIRADRSFTDVTIATLKENAGFDFFILFIDYKL